MKNQTGVLVEKLKLSKILENLQTYLTVDFITKLWFAAEKDIILVVYDKLFKMVHFVATTEEMLVKELMWLFRDNVWKLYGLSMSMCQIEDCSLQ